MRRKQNTIVAEICLYGNHKIGAGYLARVTEATNLVLGDGEPREGRNFTSAVWMAQDDLAAVGVESGTVRIYAADGQFCADIEQGRMAPYFGNLIWKLAPVLEISAEELEKAAQ
jgi:hypothetical protein